MALFFVVILFASIAYTLIFAKFFGSEETLDIKPISASGKGGREKPGSIAEAVTAERPVIVSAEERKERFNDMMKEKPEIKAMETAADVENPTIWIYMSNDGSRKDNLASEYCRWLHDNGIMAAGVTILDASARAQGKIVETGESVCR